MEFENNMYFWQKLDTLILSTEINITQPKDSVHPKYANLVYPVDYGCLSDTLATNGDKVDVFIGTMKPQRANAVVVACDILKKDIEVKLLLGCTEQEELEILHFINQTDFQKGIILHRGNNIPSWAVDDN